MAGLALKGILFGVDKIPDKWFEKIPYYRAEDDKKDKKRDKKDKDGGRRRRHSVDDRYRSDDDKNQKRRDRPHRSQDYDSEDDYEDDRRRSDKDGSGRRSKSARGRHGQPYADFGYPNGQRVYDPRAMPLNTHSAAYPPHSPHSPHTPHSAGYAHPAAGAAMAAPAFHGHPNTYARPASSEFSDLRHTASGPAAQGYVPYADIYHKHNHRMSQTNSRTAYDDANRYRDHDRKYRGRERRRAESSSGSYGSDDSHRRGYRRNSRA